MELDLLVQVLSWEIKNLLDIFINKLWDLAALELKFRFSYAKHFTCSQKMWNIIKHCLFFCLWNLVISFSY